MESMQWMNFRHLYAFWSVSRYGGFQKAAKKIAVSQSAISEQVIQLEEYLDEKLLERTTRSVRVTERGAALLTYADEIFRKSHEINHIFRDKNETFIPAQIRIGMVGGISRNFVYRLVSRNLAGGAVTRMDIIDGSLDELNTLLKGFELDLIFSLEVPKRRDLRSLSYKTVESSPLCVAGRPELVKKIRRRRAQPLETEMYMFNHPFESDVLEDTILPRFNLACTTPVATDDISLLRFLANSGRGLAFLPEIGVQEDLSNGRLARLPVSEVPSVNFYAVFLKNGFHRELIEDFLA
jgi:LysR family transcriptional activator of nhaA